MRHIYRSLRDDRMKRLVDADTSSEYVVYGFYEKWPGNWQDGIDPISVDSLQEAREAVKESANATMKEDEEWQNPTETLRYDIYKETYPVDERGYIDGDREYLILESIYYYGELVDGKMKVDIKRVKKNLVVDYPQVEWDD